MLAGRESFELSERKEKMKKEKNDKKTVVYDLEVISAGDSAVFKTSEKVKHSIIERWEDLSHEGLRWTLVETLDVPMSNGKPTKISLADVKKQMYEIYRLSAEDCEKMHGDMLDSFNAFERAMSLVKLVEESGVIRMAVKHLGLQLTITAKETAE